MTALTRTELTPYEAQALYRVLLKTSNHSLAVGAFMTRYGQPEVLQEAADLFLSLLDELVADCSIRAEALEYGQAMAKFGMNDRHGSQARQLRENFMHDLYSAAVADREHLAAKAGA